MARTAWRGHEVLHLYGQTELGDVKGAQAVHLVAHPNSEKGGTYLGEVEVARGPLERERH